MGGRAKGLIFKEAVAWLVFDLFISASILLRTKSLVTKGIFEQFGRAKDIHYRCMYMCELVCVLPAAKTLS